MLCFKSEWFPFHDWGKWQDAKSRSGPHEPWKLNCQVRYCEACGLKQARYLY